MSKYNDGRSIRVLAFLEAYHRQECLWDTTLDSYKNKGERDRAYMAIINELNVPTLTVHDIKSKVKGIRTTYTKELRILNAHKKLGKPYKPKLFWFNRANAFLRNVCVSRGKKEIHSKYECENQSDSKEFPIKYGKDEDYTPEEIMPENEELDDDEQTQDNDDTHENFKDYIRVVKEAEPEEEYQIKEQPPTVDENYPVHLTCPEIPRLNQRTEITNTTETSFQHPTTTTTTTTGKEDEFDLFCRSVAGQLRAIPDSYSRSMAKLKIQQILFEAETGHYKNSPCVTIPIVQQINGL